jgi:hypothetical protein
LMSRTSKEKQGILNKLSRLKNINKIV